MSVYKLTTEEKYALKEYRENNPLDINKYKPVYTINFLSLSYLLLNAKPAFSLSVDDIWDTIDGHYDYYPFNKSPLNSLIEEVRSIISEAVKLIHLPVKGRNIYEMEFRIIDVIAWIEKEQIPLKLPKKLVTYHKKKNNVVNGKDLLLALDNSQKEKDTLEQRVKELEMELEKSSKVICEKGLAFFIIDKIPELEQSKDWKEFMKGNSTKGAIVQRMKSKNLAVDVKSFEDILEVCCKLYWKSQKPKDSKK